MSGIQYTRIPDVKGTHVMSNGTFEKQQKNPSNQARKSVLIFIKMYSDATSEYIFRNVHSIVMNSTFS